MRRFIDAVHDIWCAVTKRCRVSVKDDPYITWMRDQERAAITSAENIRRRRANPVEPYYLKGRRR